MSKLMSNFHLVNLTYNGLAMTTLPHTTVGQHELIMHYVTHTQPQQSSQEPTNHSSTESRVTIAPSQLTSIFQCYLAMTTTVCKCLQ